MLRIRTETLTHAHIVGDVLGLGVELPCIDQILHPTTPTHTNKHHLASQHHHNPSIPSYSNGFEHMQGCISMRLAASLYHKLDPNEQRELLSLCSLSPHSTSESPSRPPPNNYNIYTTQSSPLDRFSPIGTELYLERYTQVVSQCECSLESARRYALTGSILTHTHLQALMYKLVTISGVIGNFDVMQLRRQSTTRDQTQSPRIPPALRNQASNLNLNRKV
jgi:hypothetical protein